MNATKEVVTPKKAMQWLKTNHNNRPLSSKVVKKYASIIRDGKWALNGETIKFDVDGNLIDGQHRLNGCVEAGVQFETYVIRGLPSESFDTLDQGNKRTGADVFARRGEKHYTSLAAAANLLYRYKTQGDLSVQGAYRIDMLVDILTENPTLRDSVQFAMDVAKSGKLLSPSVVGFLHFIFSELDRDDANKFLTGVLLGESLNRQMPEYVIRKRLIDNASSFAKIRSTDLAALTIKAWNFSRMRKPCGVLKYTSDERFPKAM